MVKKIVILGIVFFIALFAFLYVSFKDYYSVVDIIPIDVEVNDESSKYFITGESSYYLKCSMSDETFDNWVTKYHVSKTKDDPNSFLGLLYKDRMYTVFRNGDEVEIHLSVR